LWGKSCAGFWPHSYGTGYSRGTRSLPGVGSTHGTLPHGTLPHGTHKGCHYILGVPWPGHPGTHERCLGGCFATNVAPYSFQDGAEALPTCVYYACLFEYG